MLPVVDVVADTRDCLVPDSKLSMNVLDCGGAGFSALTSGGAIVGAVSAPTGLGVGLASASIVGGQIQNLGDAVSIGVTWIRHSPEKAVAAGRIVKEKIPTETYVIVGDITGRLGKHSESARQFRLGVNQRALSHAGASDESAEALAGVLPKVDADANGIADLTNRIEDFDQLAGAEKQLVIRTLDESSESSRLADAYDGRTLERLAAAGSGGSRGDDVLSKADEAAQAGKAEKVATLADHLDPRSLRYVLRTGAVDDAARLVDMDLSSSRFAELARHSIDVGKHRQGVETIRSAQKNPGEPGDVGEILAIEKGLVQRVADDVVDSGYTIYPRVDEFGKGVEIQLKTGDTVEFDHLLVDESGTVVRVVEDSVGKADDATATKKHTQKIESLREIEQHGINEILSNRGVSGIKGSLSKSDFAASSSEPNDVITIVAKGMDDSAASAESVGPVRTFDRSPTELKQLWKSIQNVR